MDIELQEKSDWTKIRTQLTQNYQYDEYWEQAIELFNKRIKRKFLDPIQAIIDQRVLKGEGFTIVTVQCALIEMFAAFRVGKIYNHMCKNTSPKYEYKDSRKLFIGFLHTAKIFEDHFWQLDKKGKVEFDKPYNAGEFYKNVRCGLVHEARTKDNWYINATPLTKNTKTSKQFLVTTGGKIKIYRTILHYRLLAYLTEYSNDLRQNSNNGEDLRKNFARKLDHLFDYGPDKKIDWWTV